MPMRSTLLRARHDKRRRGSATTNDNHNLLQVHSPNGLPIRRSSFTSVQDTSCFRLADDTLNKYRSKSSTTLSDRRSSSCAATTDRRPSFSRDATERRPSFTPDQSPLLGNHSHHRRPSYSPLATSDPGYASLSNRRRSSAMTSQEPTLYVPESRRYNNKSDPDELRIRKMNVAVVMAVISSAVFGVAFLAYYFRTLHL